MRNITLKLAACFLALFSATAQSFACDLCAIYRSLEAKSASPGFNIGLFEQFTHFGTMQQDGHKVDIGAHRQKISAVRIKLLDTSVAAIGYIDVTRCVDGHAIRGIELPLLRALRTPLFDKIAGRFKLLDTVVIGIGNVDIAESVNGYARWSIKLSTAAAVGTPLSYKGAAGVELLNAVVKGIHDINVV